MHTFKLIVVLNKFFGYPNLVQGRRVVGVSYRPCDAVKRPTFIP
jgi:hypothetical protein